MKIRSSFVSNSSSSSFICEVCGEAEGGYDVGISDVDMCECVNGHIMHEDCALTLDEKEKLMEEFGTEWRWNVPESMCPICSLGVLSDTYVLRYVLKKLNTSKDDIVSEIKGKYKTLTELKTFINKE